MVARWAGPGVAVTFFVVLVACRGEVAESLQQACSSYTVAFRTYETHCHEVQPEGNRAVLEQRETEACVVESSAPGSNLDASYWGRVANGVNEADAACTGYDFPDPAGSRDDGAPCFVDAQCASLWCAGTAILGNDGTVIPGSSQCGQCEPRLSLGNACNYATDSCEDGLSCFESSCRKTGVLGDACAHWSDCTFPLVCRASGTCDHVLASGDACVATTDCGTDQGCDPGTRVCVPFVFALPGMACDGDIHRCERSTCDTTTGLCPVVLADGAVCDPNDPGTLCDTYARCFGGTCQIVDPRKCQ
jgi:hypothetical protein